MVKTTVWDFDVAPEALYEALSVVADTRPGARRQPAARTVLFDGPSGVITARALPSSRGATLSISEPNAVFVVGSRGASEEANRLTAGVQEVLSKPRPAADQALPASPEARPDQAQALPREEPVGGAQAAELVEQLERLAALRASGALDENEFALAKRRLLEQPAQPCPASAAPAPVAGGGGTRMLGAAAAGAAGGFLLSGVGAAHAAGGGPGGTEQIAYHEAISGPGGDVFSADGTITESISGDTMHIVDQGTMNIGGDSYVVNDSYDVELPDGGGDGGGFLDALGSLFGF
jgi:hypothetical protein